MRGWGGTRRWHGHRRTAFLSRGQTRLHPWVESVKLLINEPPSMCSRAPTRVCGGTCTVTETGVWPWLWGKVWGRVGLWLCTSGTGQVPFFFLGRCVVPSLNVLPRKYVDCMDVCLSKLVENTTSGSSEILYKFLCNNPSSVLFYRHI